jgi:hypothetical protein
LVSYSGDSTQFSGRGNETNSMGSGVYAFNKPQEQIAPEYQRAIESVVHPDTLAEWREAGQDYPLGPEDQAGVRFKVQTMNSPYRDIAIDQVWRKKIGGEEVLLAHVIEWADNEMHNKLSWDRMVGKRRRTIFENVFDGIKFRKSRRVDSEDVYFIRFSKEEAENILAAHNVKKISTKFLLDAGYTTLGSITKEDFLNLSFEDLHYKYVRGVTLQPGAKFVTPPANYTGDRNLSTMASIPSIHPLTPPPPGTEQTYPGLSAITGKNLAIIMSVEGGIALGEQILNQVALTNPTRARELSLEARKYIETLREQQLSTQVISGTAEDSTQQKPVEEPVSVEENVGFVRTTHDDKGNPIKKEHTHSDGTVTETDLSEQEEEEKDEDEQQEEEQDQQEEGEKSGQ